MSFLLIIEITHYISSILLNISNIGIIIARTIVPTNPANRTIINGSIKAFKTICRSFHFFLVEIGNFRQHRIQRTGLLTDRNHMGN